MRTVYLAHSLQPDARLPRPGAPLVAALSLVADGTADDKALEEAICEYTRVLRNAGAPPEKTLVSVKAAAQAAGIERVSYEVQQTTVERIVRWCIREYYDVDRRQPPASVT
jgi:hypothetical protein